jgi:soluble lytic murein transglycosylase-like protein
MSDLKTSRPYQERLLDGYGRSELRRDVQKVRPKLGAKLRRKYATWALGASLAIGGLGAPMKMIERNGQPEPRKLGASSAAQPADASLQDDLRAAQRIAEQVSGGVKAVASGVEAATTAPLKEVAEAPKKLAVVTESAKEQFFKTEVPFGSIIYREAKKNDLDPELVAAVVQAESRFKPTARSHAGAVGLMQLVPRTGRWMGARDLTNPSQNIAAGAKYLRYLNERFDGNQDKVIAAYNAGEGNVRRFGGIPPFKETRSYVKKVKNYREDFGARVDSTVAAMNATPVTQGM